VLGRIEAGRLRPRSAFELSYAIVSALAQGQEGFVELVTRARVIPPDCQPLVADLEDQFDRVAGVADGQVRYLEGVIEFYKARTDTKVMIAAERLALIAVLTLPITALSSVYGMNIIVNDRTDFPHLWWCWRRWSPCRPSCCAGPSDRDGCSRFGGLAEHQILIWCSQPPSLLCLVNGAVNVLPSATCAYLHGRPS
jgi:hypothetical protein